MHMLVHRNVGSPIHEQGPCGELAYFRIRFRAVRMLPFLRLGHLNNQPADTELSILVETNETE